MLHERKTFFVLVEHGGVLRLQQFDPLVVLQAQLTLQVLLSEQKRRVEAQSLRKGHGQVLVKDVFRSMALLFELAEDLLV